MKKFCLAVLLVCALLLHAAAQTTASDEDFQSWNDVQLTAPLGKRVDAVLTGTFRFGSNIQRLVDRRASLAFNFKLNDWLTIQPGYTNISTTPRIGRERVENRLTFAATYKFPFKKFTLTNRSLFERRLRSPQNATRYRNKISFDVPFFKVAKTRFVATNEVFYDWSLNRWSRNRASVGLSRAVNKNLTVEVYFMRQNDGTTRPGDLSIIGTTFKIKP